MKILVISDEESPSLYEYFKPEKVAGVELILSCGDLKPEYLSFLVTMIPVPLLYVHGNHDGCYSRRPPEGCECIEDRVVNVNGVRILGLGGSIRYSTGEHQYTEEEMARRVQKAARQVKRAGGVDIILTHTPPRGFGDEDTHAHRGFEAFLPLIREEKPEYLLHGHVHKSYAANKPMVCDCGSTRVVNCCGYRILDVQPPKTEVKPPLKERVTVLMRSRREAGEETRRT